MREKKEKEGMCASVRADNFYLVGSHVNINKCDSFCLVSQFNIPPITSGKSAILVGCGYKDELKYR